jgi:hypothetical protein
VSSILNLLMPSDCIKVGPESKNFYESYYALTEERGEQTYLNFRNSKTDQSNNEIAIFLFTSFLANPLLYLKENLSNLYHIWVLIDHVNLKIKQDEYSDITVSIKVSSLINN